MKRIIFCIMAASYAALPAMASATAGGGNAAVYPENIIISGDKTEIRKVYEHVSDDTPRMIPQGGFKLNGYRYDFFDMTKESPMAVERKEVTETVTLQSKGNDMETVMPLLPQTKEMTYEDGFSGKLSLDISSIKAEPSYANSTRTVTATRTYPNLSDADMRHIPKTTEQDGRTLGLENVRWQTDNTMDVDGYEIPDRYSAIATYSKAISGQYISGYTITADYKGEVVKADFGNARYTAIFVGKPAISPPIPLIIAAVALVLPSCGYMLSRKLRKKRKKRKGKTKDEETIPADDGLRGINCGVADYPGVSDGL